MLTDVVQHKFFQTLEAEDQASGLTNAMMTASQTLEQAVGVADRFAGDWTKSRVLELLEYDTINFLSANILISEKMESILGIQLLGRSAATGQVCGRRHARHRPTTRGPSRLETLQTTYVHRRQPVAE